MPKNYCIMQIWAGSGKSALPICNYSQILYQFLTFTQNLKRSHKKRTVVPLTRNDLQNYFKFSISLTFKPTFLLRGTTFISLQCTFTHIHSNPRSSCEERLFNFAESISLNSFKPTFLLRGTTFSQSAT